MLVGLLGTWHILNRKWTKANIHREIKCEKCARAAESYSSRSREKMKFSFCSFLHQTKILWWIPKTRKYKTSRFSLNTATNSVCFPLSLRFRSSSPWLRCATRITLMVLVSVCTLWCFIYLFVIRKTFMLKMFKFFGSNFCLLQSAETK